MGCFQSKPQAGAPAQAHETSAQVRPLEVAASPGTEGPQSLRGRRARAQATPLKPARPWRAADTTSGPSRSSAGPWTSRSLRRERSIFFDTRVTGRPELWQAVQLAVEMARESGDLQGAYSVLDAAGCSVPKGRIEDGVWDESGVLYNCPYWVVSNPVDLDMQDDEADADKEHRLAAGQTETELETDEDGKEQDLLERQRSEKGKGKGKGQMQVRARLSDRGTDVVVTVEGDASVKVLIRSIKEEAHISSNIKVKIAYLGKILRDGEPLESQGWKRGHVLNVLVFQT